ncbi:DUF664 domain-containing protein [Cellulomonas sp. PhB143]|uniref:mycothiol transferase n=1 Tax=Cellulomonas sp. PhB143 TaxID=2485186 RepID=UPI000F46F790|nr:DUF664 domain-containing protein [Cellulomonas sp. PhB143]ROS75369.1 uncharacterized protein DUF664 [Cellulomonas sp. PhB143]
MTDDTAPWEPPFSGPADAQIVAALDRLRATFRWKADGLDAAGLRARVGASALTLGGLLKHLALIEDHCSAVKMAGEPLGAPWEGAGAPDDEFVSAAGDAPSDLYALWDGAVARSRARLAAASGDSGLDGPAHVTGPGGEPVSLRRLVCDLVEEYGRHTGHADLLREAVDGRVGEDPPDAWRPVGAVG